MANEGLITITSGLALKMFTHFKNGGTRSEADMLAEHLEMQTNGSAEREAQREAVVKAAVDAARDEGYAAGLKEGKASKAKEAIAEALDVPNNGGIVTHNQTGGNNQTGNMPVPFPGNNFNVDQKGGTNNQTTQPLPFIGKAPSPVNTAPKKHRK